MIHAKKAKIARKLMAPIERKLGMSKWDSAGWRQRKEAIAKRVAKKQADAHTRALKRKETNL